MKYKRLGNCGLKLSRIGLGMMSYGDPAWRPWVKNLSDAKPFVALALELGINFFDTADMYSDGASEQVTGKLLGEMVSRDQVVIATKAFFPHNDSANAGGLSRKHLFEAIERSLSNLATDYVDIFQIHRFDYDTPIEETMDALDAIVSSGKARYIGASSMWTWQFAMMQHVAERAGTTRFVSMQNHYNLLYREEEREMIPFCEATGVGLIPWSPLARGRLAGNRDKNGTKYTGRAKSDSVGEHFYARLDSWDVAARVREKAEETGYSPAQIALAWHMSKAAITAPIVGATKEEHLKQAVAATEIELDDEIVSRLEEPYSPQWVTGHE